MSYELPPHEREKFRRVETAIMLFFGTLIVLVIFGVVYSRFRPPVAPSNLSRVEGRPANAPGTAPVARP